MSNIKYNILSRVYIIIHENINLESELSERLEIVRTFPPVTLLHRTSNL